MPPPLSAAEHHSEIARIRASLPEHARHEKSYAANNLPLWTTYFQRRHADELASTNEFPTPRGHHNSDCRYQWWGVPRRMLQTVLEHIEGGNKLPLEYSVSSLSRLVLLPLLRHIAATRHREGRAPGDVGAPSQP
ncbi:Protein kinase APK1A, chloroplastic [Hordeum vulgare]|nr:Protein kinase APK1A, chloroplastic [Hordeum vulgare]